VISVPGADEDGASAFEGLWDQANAELAAMVDEGLMKARLGLTSDTGWR
jgi:hypothetical protein